MPALVGAAEPVPASVPSSVAVAVAVLVVVAAAAGAAEGLPRRQALTIGARQTRGRTGGHAAQTHQLPRHPRRRRCPTW